MITITPNPGFALIIGALLAFASPKAFRGAIMAGAPMACLALILWKPFGDYRGFTQIGLEVVQFRLDELSYIFGLTFAVGAILIGIASSQRRDRYEDAAVLSMAGGATTAVFSGDLISFIAAAELSSLSGAWIVLAAGGRSALDAGVRLLIWQGLGGLLLLCGVAFHLADGFGNAFTQLPADSIGGAFFLAGLAIKVGAPLAHVWFKDALSHASPAGAAALSIFSAKLALYGLARAFYGEPLLLPAGVALAVLGALYALAEDDLRRATAYSLLAQIGLSIAAIGIGTPAAIAAASAHAFTTTFAYLILFLATGTVLLRTGTARASQLGGLARTMPVTALFAIVGALAAAGLPFLAVHASQAMASQAILQEGWRWAWVTLLAASAATAAFAAVRLPLALFFGRERTPGAEAPFPFLLPMAISAFLVGAVGVAPGWLQDLAPPQRNPIDVLSFERWAPQLEFVAAAAFGYGSLAFFGLAASRRPFHLLDIDAFYRGPLAYAARVLGAGLLRLYGAIKSALDAGIRQLGHWIVAGAKASDRPFAAQPLTDSGSLAVFLLVLLIVYVFAS